MILFLVIAGALSLLSWFMVLYWGRMLPFVGNAFQARSLAPEEF